jgi:hypothetical protein
VVLYLKGIDNSGGGLNLITEIIVKAVLVNTLSRNCTVEAAETSALEGIFGNVDDLAFHCQRITEALNH